MKVSARYILLFSFLLCVLFLLCLTIFFSFRMSGRHLLERESYVVVQTQAVLKNPLENKRPTLIAKIP